MPLTPARSARASSSAPAYAASHPSAVALVGQPYGPQPNRMMTWPDDVYGAQFTAGEEDQLATEFSQVVIGKAHDDYTNRQMAPKFQAVNDLVSRNPNLGVYFDLSGKFWYLANNWGVTFDPSWYLKDNTGRSLCTKAGTPIGSAYCYIDLTNNSYRAWVKQVVLSWMQQSPATGLAFDSVDPIGVSSTDTAYWAGVIGPARVSSYNRAMVSLVTEMTQLMHSIGKRTWYNGFAPSPGRDASRNLSMLSTVDGGVDESFCITLELYMNSNTPVLNPILPDLQIMQQHKDKMLGMFTLYKHGNAAFQSLGPYCFGAFMMGWQVGSSYFRFAESYFNTSLSYQLPDARINIGTPTAPFHQAGNLLSRTFTNGSIYVNTDPSATLSFVAPQALVGYAGGLQTGTVAAGATVSIRPNQALFYLNPKFVSTFPGNASATAAAAVPVGLDAASEWRARPPQGPQQRRASRAARSTLNQHRMSPLTTVPGLPAIDNPRRRAADGTLPSG